MEIKHLAIIPDGNRRWARERGLELDLGYKEGLKKFYMVLKWLLEEIYISEISFYVLSYDNYVKRSVFEQKVFLNILKKELDDIIEGKNEFLKIIESSKTKVNFFGSLNLLPKEIQEKINIIENKTKNNKNRILNILICYSGRREIIDAIKKIKNIEEIDEEKFKEYLWVKRDLDLVIRTGGYNRLSDLLLFQSAYAEIIVIDKYWPDITIDDIKKAINTYYNIRRNFGK